MRKERRRAAEYRILDIISGHKGQGAEGKARGKKQCWPYSSLGYWPLAPRFENLTSAVVH